MWPNTLSILASAALLVFSSVAPQAAEHVFTVLVENVSMPNLLKLSNGKTVSVTLGPVLYVVHTNRGPVFTSGQPDRDEGLEALAEDGPVAPLAKSLEGKPGIVHVGFAGTPVGAGRSRPLRSGEAFEFKVGGKPGERLTIATMLGQSNDLFYAPREEGIALFDASGEPIAGDITSQILLWDAGTEINEEPGLGLNQSAFQAAGNTGPEEHGVVRPISDVKDRFHYPTVAEVLRVTITVGPTALRCTG
jgi:hypothetical protein